MYSIFHDTLEACMFSLYFICNSFNIKQTHKHLMRIVKQNASRFHTLIFMKILKMDLKEKYCGVANTIKMELMSCLLPKHAKYLILYY
jgi:hypothetical protein